MSLASNRHTIGIAIALAIALAIAVVAMSRDASAAATASNVSLVKTSFSVSNGSVNNAVAKCPAGKEVFSGAFASNGQHARFLAAGPSSKENGYVVYAFMPPANLRAGVLKETATITVVAWCAPSGQPIVL